ncbi:endonuclease domain-containing protein [Modestobacter sp. SYSU DS0511]
MPPVPLVPEELRSGAFRGSTAVRAGLLTRRQLSGASWRRLFHDVYVHRDQPVTHDLRARGAALLLPSAVVTGASAAVLWGLDAAGPDDDVEVTMRPGTSMVRVAGLRARRARLRPADVVRRKGLRTTTPAATAVRLAAELPLEPAVCAVDQLVARGVVDLAAVRARATVARGPGSARARTVAALADGRAGSPQETRVRLLIGWSGLPAPVAQFEVRHGGRFVARVDFAWPAQRLALEYDGLWHAEPGQFARDRERLNRLREAGWRVVFVTAADLRDPARLVARIAAALAA